MTSTTRPPALFLPHGGGPLPLLNDAAHKPLINFLKGPARKYLEPRPKAILIISAHWEESHPTVSTVSTNKLLYDYHGFPQEAYNISFPAHGDPAIANRVVQLLQRAGFTPKTDDKRGWDHGVFVPLKLLLPDFDIPIIAMSVLSSQSAADHYRMGRAIESLRDSQIMIIGSGMSFHNFAVFRRGFSLPPDAKVEPVNIPFDKALELACKVVDPVERGKLFDNWEAMPGAREAHPERASEHLSPLIVVAGAGGEGEGRKVLEWDTWGCRVAAYLWQQ